MKLPVGWPDVKVPRGWPEPNIDPRLVEAVQDPQYRNTVLGLEQTLRRLLGRSDVGAVVQLPYFDNPYLRCVICKLAHHYRLRALRNSTTCFWTKNWTAPVYALYDIPEVLWLQPTMDGTGVSQPALIRDGTGASPIKPSLTMNGTGLVEVGNSLKLGLGPNQTETISHAEEVSETPGLVEVVDSLKLGLRLNRTEIQSPEEMDVDDYETSENKGNLMSRKRNRDYKWENEGDMLLALKTNQWLQLEAVCALYRQERMTREQNTISLSASDYKRITRLVEFLTEGNEEGPCVREPEELEEIYPGSTALCSWLVVTYANQLYHIYCNESDLYFG